MNTNYNSCVVGSSLPSTPNDLKILVQQLMREVEELSKNTEATLLRHDGKIAELVLFVKNNLSNSIRCLLDTMLDNGELEQIITDTLLSSLNQKIYFVGCAKDLEQSLYQEGEVIRTLGYQHTGDGVTNLYKVRKQLATDTFDNGNIIPLLNNNVAELVKEDESIDLKQLGCTGDGKTDVTKKIAYALANYKEVVIKNGTYIINDTLNVLSNTDVSIINAKIKSTTATNKKYIFNIASVNNVSIKGINATLEFNKPSVVQQACIQVTSSTNVRIEGLTMSKAGGDGMIISGSDSVYSKNVEVVNCTMDNNTRQGISFVGGVDGCLVDNCRFTNTGNAEPGAGIDIETWKANLYNRNIIIKDSYFKNNYQNRGIIVFEYTDYISIINNTFDNEDIAVKLNSNYVGNAAAIPKNILIKNNVLKGTTIFMSNLRGDFDISDNYIDNGRIFLQSIENASIREQHLPSTIMNNTINANNKIPVYIEGMGNIIVKNNAMKRCSQALATIGARDIEFSNNLIYEYNVNNNQDRIFDISTTTNILIENNKLIKNSDTPISKVLIVQASTRNLIFRRNNLLKCAYTTLIQHNSGAGLEGIAYDNITENNINESINLYLPDASKFYSGIIIQKLESGILNNYICKYDTDESRYRWIKL